ncbi:TatD family hydrolase [Nibricoccus sp. IMCC34717]|uniref:TatD family hydrolase n=1 Tax=Nibricoccus sp. IMCC34717 TaxID=3034021 RepID=UPI0038504BC0
MIDTHCHLDGYHARGELAAVLARAKAAGLAGLVTIGTDPGDWPLYRKLAAENPGFVWHTVGLHPCNVDERWPEALAVLEDWDDAGTPPVALGECGLDRFHLPKDPAEAEKVIGWQKAAFAAQLELVKRWRCPLVVHSRGAFAETVAMIDAAGIAWPSVVFHCFVEGEAEMDALLARGATGSFTGIITYKNAPTVRAAMLRAGAARTFFETDAPYLTPEPHRGKPNEPALITHTFARAAELFGMSVDALSEITDGNARKFYGI